MRRSGDLARPLASAIERKQRAVEARPRGAVLRTRAQNHNAPASRAVARFSLRVAAETPRSLRVAFTCVTSWRDAAVATPWHNAAESPTRASTATASSSPRTAGQYAVLGRRAELDESNCGVIPLDHEHLKWGCAVDARSPFSFDEHDIGAKLTPPTLDVVGFQPVSEVGEIRAVEGSQSYACVLHCVAQIARSGRHKASGVAVKNSPERQFSGSTTPPEDSQHVPIDLWVP